MASAFKVFAVFGCALLSTTPAHAALWCGAEAGQIAFVSPVFSSNASVEDAAEQFVAYLRDQFPFNILSETALEASCAVATTRGSAEKARAEWVAQQREHGHRLQETRWFSIL